MKVHTNCYVFEGSTGKVAAMHGALMVLEPLLIQPLGCPVAGDAGEFFDDGLHNRVAPGSYELVDYRPGCTTIALVTLSWTATFFKNSAGSCWHYAGRVPVSEWNVAKTTGEEFRLTAEAWHNAIHKGG